MERTDRALRRRVHAICLAATTLTLGTILTSSVALAATQTGDSGYDDIDDREIYAPRGIKASLRNSLDVKKDEVGSVDIISAEDVGTFPDSNLATALARLPGIAASHEASTGFTSTGDATSITVRGFGQTFNTTLYDGRQLASATGTRAFDFSSIGTESVNSVHVLKTPDTTLSSGAIGATVNIINRLPFDNVLFRYPLYGFVSGTDASGEGKITPNGALLFSDTYADNTFGVLADIAYAQTKTKGNHTNIEGWTGTQLTCSQFATTPASCAGFYDIAASWYMQDRNNYEEHNDQKRTSGRVALQWRPAGDLLFTINDDYSKDTLSQQIYGYSSWFNGGLLTNVVRNSNGTVTSFIDPSSVPSLVDADTGRVMENNDVGANIKWDVTKHQTYVVDYSSSTSKLNPEVGTPPFISPLNKNTVDQFKLQGTWKNEELKLDYGAQYTTNNEDLKTFAFLNFNNYSNGSPPPGTLVTPIQSIDPLQSIIEHTQSFFLNGLWKISFGSTRLSINTGVREEQTKVTSQGFNQQLPTALTVQATDHTAFLVSYSASMPISQDNRYNYLLPNLDLNFDITDALKLRADVSRTLTRPPLSAINPDIYVSPNQRVGALFANGGNARLLPYLSYNRDLGVEWYYTKDSYLAADAFMKNISNAVLYGNVLGAINNVVDPTTNQPAQFNILTQVNGLSFRVSGIELSLQHLFGNSGFGLMANTTFLGSDKHYDRYNLVNSGVPITGLTNSWNVVGFYDKPVFQCRIAINHQSEALTFLGQEVNNSAFGAEPTYSNAATQVDANASYYLNLHLSVYLDGQNLNNARYNTHGRFPEQLLNSVETGRRFTAGIYFKL